MGGGKTECTNLKCEHSRENMNQRECCSICGWIMNRKSVCEAFFVAQKRVK